MTRASSSASRTTSSMSCAAVARTSTTSSSRTRGTTCSSSRTACAATTRSRRSSPSSSETREVVLGVDVGELARIELDDRRVHVAQRVVAAQELLLEQRQRRAAKGSGQRAGRRDGISRGSEPAEGARRDQGAVDGEEDADVVRRRAQARDDSGDRCANRRVVVDDGEGEWEPVVRLADSDALVARVAEYAPGAFGERLATVLCERLRRTEARARAADEQDACHS